MYTIEMLKEFFGWCSVINVAILMFTFLFILLTRKVVLTVHHKLFNVDEKYLNQAYFKYLAQYKIIIIVFNIVPYFVLSIMS